MIKRVGVSDARKHMADFFSDAVYKNKLTVFSRYEKERAFLVGEKLMDLLVCPEVPANNKEVIEEEDGSYTVHYLPLDLLTNQDNYEEAIEDLVCQAKDYASDFLDNVELYLSDESRKKHLPFMVAIAKATSDDEIKSLMGLLEEQWVE